MLIFYYLSLFILLFIFIYWVLFFSTIIFIYNISNDTFLSYFQIICIIYLSKDIYNLFYIFIFMFQCFCCIDYVDRYSLLFSFELYCLLFPLVVRPLSLDRVLENGQSQSLSCISPWRNLVLIMMSHIDGLICCHSIRQFLYLLNSYIWNQELFQLQRIWILRTLHGYRPCS